MYLTLYKFGRLGMADIRRTYGGHMVDIRLTYGRYMADGRQTYGEHTAIMLQKWLRA